MGCCCCCLACFCCFSCCPCCWRLDFCFVVAAAALAIPFQQICWAFVRVCIVLPQKVHNRLDSNTHPSVGHPFKNCGGGIRHCFLCFTVFRYFFVFCFLLPERLHINLNDLHAAQLRFQIKLVTHLVIINFRTLVVDFSLRFAACLLLLFFLLLPLLPSVVGFCCCCCCCFLVFLLLGARETRRTLFFNALLRFSSSFFAYTLRTHTLTERHTRTHRHRQRAAHTDVHSNTHTHRHALWLLACVFFIACLRFQLFSLGSCAIFGCFFAEFSATRRSQRRCECFRQQITIIGWPRCVLFVKNRHYEFLREEATIL